MKQKVLLIAFAHNHVVPEPQGPIIFGKTTFALDWMVAVALQQNSKNNYNRNNPYWSHHGSSPGIAMLVYL